MPESDDYDEFKAPDVQVGQRVEALRNGAKTYVPGEVLSRDGDEIDIKYDDSHPSVLGLERFVKPFSFPFLNFYAGDRLHRLGPEAMLPRSVGTPPRVRIPIGCPVPLWRYRTRNGALAPRCHSPLIAPRTTARPQAPECHSRLAFHSGAVAKWFSSIHVSIALEGTEDQAPEFLTITTHVPILQALVATGTEALAALQQDDAAMAAFKTRMSIGDDMEIAEIESNSNDWYSEMEQYVEAS